MEPHMEAIADHPMSSLPSDRFEEVQQKPRKSRLTMKVLLEQIEELQKENALLAKRLHVLEGRMVYPHPLWRDEIAAAIETPSAADTGETGTLLLLDCNVRGECDSMTEAVHALPVPVQTSLLGRECSAVVPQPKPIFTPRSERHPVRKRSFWMIFLPFRNRFY